MNRMIGFLILLTLTTQAQAADSSEVKLPIVNKINVVQVFQKSVTEYNQEKTPEPVDPNAPVPLSQVKGYRLETYADYSETNGHLNYATASFFQGKKKLWSLQGDMDYDSREGRMNKGPLFFPKTEELWMFKYRVSMFGEEMVKKDGTIIFDTDVARFSKDYRYVAFRSDDTANAFCILDRNTGSKKTISVGDNYTYFIAFDSDPFYLLLGSWNGLFKFDDTGKEQLSYQADKKCENCISYLGLADDGNICVLENLKDSLVVFINWYTGKVIKTLPLPKIKNGKDEVKIKEIHLIAKDNLIAGVAFKDYDPKNEMTLFEPVGFAMNFNGEILWQKELKPSFDAKYFTYQLSSDSSNQLVFTGLDVIGFSYQTSN